MSASQQRIVADGDRRYREARDYKSVRMRVLTDVSRRYERERANASFWRRCWIELLIRREVRAHMKREFPAGSLHLAAFGNKKC